VHQVGNYCIVFSIDLRPELQLHSNPFTSVVYVHMNSFLGLMRRSRS